MLHSHKSLARLTIAVAVLVYLQSAFGQTFTLDTTTTLLGGFYDDAAWGDYDNDGDLDILFVGVKDFWRNMITRIYRNDGIKANSKPAPPTNLTTVVSRDSVVFRWTKSQDDETPSSSLSYNLSVGASPASSNIVSPMASLSTGHRLVANMGNAGQSAMWKIKNLPGGKYYWSVQAIDHAFAGSEFAPAQSFVVPPSATQITVACKSLHLGIRKPDISME